MATPTYPLLPDKALPNALFNWAVPSLGFNVTTNRFQALQIDANGALVVSGSGGGSTSDRELVVSTYFVSTAFTGASVGDTVTATQVIDVTAAPTTVSTIWRNQTTGADFANAPTAANLTLVGAQALTNAQLRESAVPVTDSAAEASLSTIARNTGNIPAKGSATMAGALPVTLATDGPGVANLSTIASNTTGVATAANQTTGNGYLSTISTNSGTQATAANQTSANTKLDQLHTDMIAATPAGSNFIGFAGTAFTTASANFTRPSDTTAYAIGDLVANSTTAGSVTPMTLAVSRVNDASVMIRRVRLKTNDTAITSGTVIRVHLFKDSPTVTNGDNGAFLSTESNYLGSLDVPLDRTFSDALKGLGAANTGSEINCMPSTGTQNIFALLEARSAFTPASGKVWTLTVETIQN